MGKPTERTKQHSCNVTHAATPADVRGLQQIIAISVHLREVLSDVLHGHLHRYSRREPLPQALLLQALCGDVAGLTLSHAGQALGTRGGVHPKPDSRRWNKAVTQR